jgi:hypothetical protein
MADDEIEYEIRPDDVPDLLQQVYTAARPGENSYCILHWNAAGYGQCLSQHGRAALWCELVSVNSDPALAEVLTGDRVARLQQLGFAAPDRRSPNFYQIVPIESRDSFERIAALLLTAMRDVYGFDDTLPLYAKRRLPVGASVPESRN